MQCEVLLTSQSLTCQITQNMQKSMPSWRAVVLTIGICFGAIDATTVDVLNVGKHSCLTPVALQ